VKLTRVGTPWRTLRRWSLRDSPALLASCGVWLNSAIASNNASPDPPAAVLLGSAERVRQGVPTRAVVYHG